MNVSQSKSYFPLINCYKAAVVQSMFYFPFYRRIRYVICMVLLVLFPNSICVDYFEIDGKDPLHYHRIGGVIVGVLSSSAVDRGFEPRSGKTKEQRRVGSESESCVRMERHVYLRTVVSVS